MQRRFRAPALLLAAAIASYVYAQVPEIRPGQWSFTMRGTMTGFGDTSDLPPEVLAQIQEQFSGPSTYETCLTREDIAELSFGEPGDEDDSCAETARAIDDNVIMLTHECSDRTDTMRVEIESPESLKVTIDSEGEDGAATLSITGQWVGAVCTED